VIYWQVHDINVVPDYFQTAKLIKFLVDKLVDSVLQSDSGHR
jgi:hypothetical protein